MTRLLTPLMILIGAVALVLLGDACHYLGIAHAQGATPGPASEPPGSVNWELLLLGAIALFSAIRTVLAFVAPRTKTTWDDRRLADLDQLLNVLGILRGPRAPVDPAAIATPATTNVSINVPPPPARDPQAGMVAPRMLALLVPLAIGVLALQPACATVKATPGAAATAVVECAKADARPILDLLAELGVQASLSALKLGAIDWPGLEASAIAQGKVTGGCALTRFVAELAKVPAEATAVASLLAPPDPAADGRAAVTRLSARFGGATWAVQ